jgi:vacuolar protein sorting-associated protein 35
VSCRDELAQQYLTQAVIQGFPDAFHLGTLDALLGALPDLQPGVKLHAVMASLMERLARCAVELGAVLCVGCVCRAIYFVCPDTEKN